MNSVLRVQNLFKTFALYKNPRQRLLELFFGGKRHRLHQVLKDINFCIEPGEAVGILGVNGAGKSTLLKLIAGVLKPDQGQIFIKGRVAGLLELGTGFDVRLSGRQNIYINAQLNGLSFTETVDLESAIIEFAELQNVIDDPLRTYSSGMVMRLGFAVAIHVKPSCFVLDEALAVGDAAFQQKCLSRLKVLLQQGASILVVSHDLNAIKMLCSRAILIHQGRILLDENPVKVCQSYIRLLAGYQVDSNIDFVYGKSLVSITNVVILGEQRAKNIFLSGEIAHIQLTVNSKIDRKISVGFLIKDKFGQDIYGTNTSLLGVEVEVNSGFNYLYDFELDLSIAPGFYTLSVAIHGDNNHLDDCEYWLDSALQFEVRGYYNSSFAGLVQLPTNFRKVSHEA